jgi:predicted dithiol-disulfide oxidoreductase (DUF899 family)
MPTHRTGTREEWLTSRLELLEQEKDLTRRSDELARRRQGLPWVPINTGYRFETDEGSASLVDLFPAACLPLYVRARLGGRLPFLLLDRRWLQWHRSPSGQS